ncbi:MAG: phosphoribosyltransferase, partial [Ignavibacteria bacterium]
MLGKKSALKLFISQRKIQRRVNELAKQITGDYKNKQPIFIGVLNGSFVFMSDLLRDVKLDTEVDFLKLSSYGDAK